MYNFIKLVISIKHDKSQVISAMARVFSWVVSQ